MKKIFTWLGANWQPLIIGVISVVVLFLVSFYNLEGITDSKLSMPEVASLESAASGREIIRNPLFLPFKLIQYGLFSLGISSIYASRAVVSLFGFVFIILFYILARHWFSARIAWMGTLMLATSGLFLNYSRLAVPDILQPLALLGLFGCAWWIHDTKRIRIALFGCAVFVAFALYIPGIIWFIALAVFAQRKHISALFKKIPVYSTVAFSLLAIVLLLPLGYAISQQPRLALDWLALPTTFNPQEVLRDFIFVPASLVVRSLPNPVFNLGRLPYLDVLTLCLSVLGAYAFMLKFSLTRTKTLIGAVIIAWFLIAFSNTVSIVIVLPLVFLTVTSGIMLLLHQWFTVFPKNPIARFIGITLLLSVISIGIYYNLTRYFYAWGNSPVTESVFQENMPGNLVQ